MSKRVLALFGATLMVVTTSCGSDSATGNDTTIGPPARIVVSPLDTTVDVGADLSLRVSVFDAAQHAISSAQVTVVSDKSVIASIATPASVRANSPGVATVTVSVGGVSGTTRISVVPHFIVVPFPPGATTASTRGMTDAGAIIGTVNHDEFGARAYRYTPSGGSEYLPGTFFTSTTNAINAAGTAVGWIRVTSDSPANLVTWPASGPMQNYGSFGVYDGARGMAINNTGQLAAYYGYLLPGYGIISHTGRFDVTTKKMTEVFDVNPAGNGQPTGLSDEGTVLGFGYLPGGYGGSFRWTSETGPRPITISNGRAVTVTSISPNGSMVGYLGILVGVVQSVFIEPSGNVKTIPPPADSLWLAPEGVTDRGDVVGNAQNYRGVPVRAMVWREDAGYLDLSVSGKVVHARGLSPDGSMAYGTMDEVVGSVTNQHPVMWILRRN